jgi:Glycosyltransferase family 87
VRDSECVDTSESAMPRRAGHLDGLAADAIGPEQHPAWLDRRGFILTGAVFAGYAAVAAFTTAGQDRVWALWALPGYGAAALLLWRGRGRAPALLVAVALALVAPLTWLSVKGPLTAGMIVVGRSAELLIGHGLPYLPPDQLSSWLSYNPYLPLMALFGMPKAADLAGMAGDPGVWMALATVALLAVVIWVVVPHPVTRCRECRRDVLVYTALAVASPLIALNLAVITTDPPVLALMLLSLALAARPSRALGAGLVLGVACAMKVTAWPEVPVLAAMFWSRDGGRAAWRFAASSAGAAAVLIAATAPAVFAEPAAIIQNAVMFPLGLTRHKTPAESLLPGHLLASTGSAGHLLSIALLLAAAVAIAVSLVIRPPRDVRAAALRLAVSLAVIFTVGPNDRFGYFVYPLGLLGWLALTSSAPVAAMTVRYKAAATRRGTAGNKPFERQERAGCPVSAGQQASIAASRAVTWSAAGRPGRR